MELNNYKKKLNLLFDKFTEKDFHLNPNHTRFILRYFNRGAEKCTEKQLLETCFFSDLVLNTILSVEKIPCREVKIFLIEIVALIAKNELQYCKLSQRYGFQMMISKINKLNETISCPAFQLAFMNLQIAQISHSSGVMIIIKQRTWTYLLTHDIHHKPVPVARAVYDFISKLVWKLNEYEEETVLNEVLQFILNPIIKSEYLTTTDMELENEKYRSDTIITYLNALLAIFNDTPNYTVPNKVIPLLRCNFLLRSVLYRVTEASRDENVLMITNKLMFRFFFASYWDYVMDSGKSDLDFLNEIITTYNNMINCILQKNSLAVSLNFIVSCITFWSEIDTGTIPQILEINGQNFDMRNQIVLLLVVPMLTYASLCKDKVTDIEAFLIKLTAISTEHVLKSYYMFKARVEVGDTKKSCLQALKEVYKLKGRLNVAQAGIVFQALYYVLYSHVYMDGSGEYTLIIQNTLKPIEDTKIITIVLDLMQMLLKDHSINWYESLEILCFQTTIMNILKQHMLPTKLLLQSLGLIDWSIKKFLSPDLTLLMDIKNGSTIKEIGKGIRGYLAHEEWEVRDAALEVVMNCTRVSYIKYEPLQKLISEYDLLIEAASLAMHDSEFYVQATALRCLAVATKVEGNWREVLAVHPQLYIQLVDMLQNNGEGILRKEAANVITELLANQRLSPPFVKYLYIVMRKAAIDDLYWEVQLAALDFWKRVIQTLLTDRGMIDGKFPGVTFSKEKRKIITLNKEEIMNQLNLLMKQLSNIGCLTVLQHCLAEDTSVTVIEHAYRITKELVDILDFYKFEAISSSPPQVEFNKHNSENLLMDFSFYRDIINTNDICVNGTMIEQDNMRDNIIDNILVTNSADLIEDLFTNYVPAKQEPMEKGELVLPNQSINHRIVDPKEFLSDFKQKDYLTLISNKQNWNYSTLDTMLDELMYGLKENCRYND